MKTFRASSLAVVALGLLAADVSAQETPESLLAQGLKRYPVESGFVEYELSGSQTGKETLYFDNWGWREARVSEKVTEMMGINTEERSLALLIGTTQYQIDLAKGTGIRMVNTTLVDMARAAPGGDLSQAGEEMMKRMGGTLVGTETVAGKECQVFELGTMGTRTCVWGGVTLRTEASMMGISMNSVAVSADFGVSVPDERFDVPEGVTLTEGPRLNR